MGLYDGLGSSFCVPHGALGGGAHYQGYHPQAMSRQQQAGMSALFGSGIAGYAQGYPYAGQQQQAARSPFSFMPGGSLNEEMLGTPAPRRLRKTVTCTEVARKQITGAVQARTEWLKIDMK